MTLRWLGWLQIATEISKLYFHKFANERTKQSNELQFGKFFAVWQVLISTMWLFGSFSAKCVSLKTPLIMQVEAGGCQPAEACVCTFRRESTRKRGKMSNSSHDKSEGMQGAQ